MSNVQLPFTGGEMGTRRTYFCDLHYYLGQLTRCPYPTCPFGSKRSMYITVDIIPNKHFDASNELGLPALLPQIERVYERKRAILGDADTPAGSVTAWCWFETEESKRRNSHVEETSPSPDRHPSTHP